jgi:hypothetical protein
MLSACLATLVAIAAVSGCPARISGCAFGGNQVIAGDGGRGIGGRAYLTPGGLVCFDAFTSLSGNTASSSDNDVYGVLTICL